MDLSDDINLGRLTDELDADEEQSDLNIELIEDHNKLEILNGIENKISRYYLEYLIENIGNMDYDFWTKIIFKKIIKVYSLNTLKLFIDRVLWNDDLLNQSLKLLFFLKVDLVGKIDNHEIGFDKTIDREEFENYLIENKAPKIFIDCIHYIDGESYSKFMNRLFLEKEMEFIE